MDLSGEEAARIRACGMDKLNQRSKRNETVHFTAVTSCALLVDWTELHRGESIELVHMFVLRLHRAARESVFLISCIAYNNACTLLALSRREAQGFLPWTQSLLQEIRMVLDRFHRANHTWCLRALPEVDPDPPGNAELLAAKKKTSLPAAQFVDHWKDQLKPRGHFFNTKTVFGEMITRMP